MYKKNLLAMLVAMLILSVGCRKTDDTPTMPNETEATGVVSAETELPTEKVEEPAEATESPTIPQKESETSDGSDTATTEQPEQNTTPEATEPPATESEATDPPAGGGMTAYEWDNSLSGEEQMKFFNTFDSMEEFVNWYNAAKAEYDRLHPDIEIGDGNINAGEINP